MLRTYSRHEKQTSSIQILIPLTGMLVFRSRDGRVIGSKSDIPDIDASESDMSESEISESDSSEIEASDLD